MATVTIQSVSKSFGPQCVLQDVNLNIEKGEFVVIVGPSGCGKSTLLRMVAGLESIDRGSILINDKCVNQTPPSARDIAMVFQNYALYPHMSVFENMAYGLKMRKMDKHEIHQRVAMAAEMLQLTDCLQRKPQALSGGQRQRVAMGRAIVRSPSVFLFDEPLSNLDSKLRMEMRHEIKKLHQQLKATCVYVTHDQTEAMTMADRVLVLQKGKVEQDGIPREVYHRPHSMFVASFLGHYPMNFIPGRLDDMAKIFTLSTGCVLPMPQIEVDAVIPDSVVVGIRPEHVSIVSGSEQPHFEASIEFIDDMGSDKLIRLETMKGAIPISIRLVEDLPINGNSCFIRLDISKAVLFCGVTGQRLGGWNE